MRLLGEAVKNVFDAHFDVKRVPAARRLVRERQGLCSSATAFLRRITSNASGTRRGYEKKWPRSSRNRKMPRSRPERATP